MKKLTMPLMDYHIHLFLPLTLLTYTFSFLQTIITANASGDNNKLPAGLTMMANGTHHFVIVNTRMAWPDGYFRTCECSAYRDQ